MSTTQPIGAVNEPLVLRGTKHIAHALDIEPITLRVHMKRDKRLRAIIRKDGGKLVCLRDDLRKYISSLPTATK